MAHVFWQQVWDVKPPSFPMHLETTSQFGPGPPVLAPDGSELGGFWMIEVHGGFFGHMIFTWFFLLYLFASCLKGAIEQLHGYGCRKPQSFPLVSQPSPAAHFALRSSPATARPRLA